MSHDENANFCECHDCKVAYEEYVQGAMQLCECEVDYRCHLHREGW